MAEDQISGGADPVVPLATDDPKSRALTHAVVQRGPEILPTGEEGIAGGTSVIARRRDGRRHLVLFSVIALAILALAPGAWAFIRSTSSGSFPAQVSSYGLVPLNFSEPGVLVHLAVAPGSVVRAGEPLARESAVLVNSTIKRDRQVLAADRARIAQLQSLVSTSESETQTGISSSFASQQAQVNAAKAALAAAQSDFGAELAHAQSNVQSDQNQISQEQNIYSTQCPSGVTAAGPTLTLAQCITLFTAIQAEQESLSVAESLVLSIQTSQEQAVATATRELSDAEALQGTGTAAANSSVSTLQAELAAALSQESRDHAQLVADRSQLQSLVLVAPVAGTVIQVSATLGTPVTPSGVALVTSQSGGVPVPKAAQLFPTSGLSSSTSGTSEPVIVIRTGARLLVTALVPQSEISHVRRGSSATFIPDVAGLPDLRLVVEEVAGFPVIANGTAQYPVTLGLSSRDTQGYLQGITGSVRFS